MNFLISAWLTVFSATIFANSIPGSQHLPQGKGRDLIIANCSPCHSLNLVTQNYMTRKTWDDTITWMQQKQGLWPLPKETRKTILDYLERYFGGNKKQQGSEFRAPINPLPRTG